MKKQSLFKKLTALAGTFLLSASVFASSVSADTTKVVVATDSDTAPFTYKDGKDFKGYDIEVVQAIFDGQKDYDLSFETVAFSSILSGIDAGRYQIGANDFNYSEERAEKYLFSEPISRSNYALAVADDQDEIKSLDDLAGKTTEALPGQSYALILEKWNKANPKKDQIKINYVSDKVTITQRLQNVESGKIDFVLYDAISLEYITDDQDIDLEVENIKEEIGDEKDGLEYLIFADDKDGKALKKFVDGRIKELTEDGTLQEISEKYFGDDFVSNID